MLNAYDLIIIGGGPAGTSAAISAARAGASVLLLERGRFPRHKVCGEFVSAESLGLLDDLLDRATCRSVTGRGSHSAGPRLPRWPHPAGHRSIPGRQHRPPRSRCSPLALRRERGRGCAAASDGAEHRRLRSVPCRDQRGEFEARALVNASGRWSNLNLPPAENGTRHEKWLGIKAHFAEAGFRALGGFVFLRGGYCGVQPVISAATRARKGKCVRHGARRRGQHSAGSFCPASRAARTQPELDSRSAIR